MTNGLMEAGGTLGYVYDPDPAKVAEYMEKGGYAKDANGVWAKDGKPLTVKIWIGMREPVHAATPRKSAKGATA